MFVLKAIEQPVQPSAVSHVDERSAPVEISENTGLSDLTPAQLYELNQSVLNDTVADRPLIAEIVPLTALRAEYEGGSQSFVKQIDYLAGLGYKGIRRTKGDGDCFYRSLAFTYIEQILHSPDQSLAVATAESLLDSSLPMLEAAGFQRMVVEDFYDVVVNLIRQVIVPEPNGTTLTPSLLLDAFQSTEVSNYVVVFMRLLTSAQIRTDPETYAPFLFNPETGEDIPPREFCERYVEAVGKEADHVQMTALTRALQTNINVAYLDGHSEDGKVNFVEFRGSAPEENENPPVLLYRPGHYDVLEKGSAEEGSTLA
ncbi:cysteine proteinase [Rickenella mellea]|uniref:ubiquitinyl hydrolase 1 n=1 Tax=Rickenella mellea TaxID=50990 RepID=A0A4Y7QH32_9AGAM|nr:cysteine proteinase [Rickenella mellea]